MKVLHLTLKKQYFDMIASGEKPEEYREMKPYWSKRFLDGPRFREFDVIEFRNGYGKNAPKMTVEFKGFRIGSGNPKWGAVMGEVYYVIKLGEIIK